MALEKIQHFYQNGTLKDHINSKFPTISIFFGFSGTQKRWISSPLSRFHPLEVGVPSFEAPLNWHVG